MVAVSTLKKREDFVRLRRGRKFTCAYFILRFAPSEPAGEGVRVGYTVTTKCGNAVARNRIKRRLRALTAELFPDGARPGTDYVFIALEGAKMESAPFEALRQAMRDGLAYAARKA